jgi:Cu+-exporting ATPase
LILISVIFTSCEKSKDQKPEPLEKQSEIAEADVKTVKLEIKGMTCEIGCAKLIQSKLYKTDGISFAEVHFADSSGVVSYDANRLTEKDLVEAVEKAGGGDLYKVSSINPATREEQSEKTPESAD